MADLEGIIADAVSDASGSNGDAEVLDAGGGDEGTVVADATLPDTGDATADADAATADAGDGGAADGTKEEKATPADAGDEIDKILEAAGVKAPKEGERENRIPYSRTRKIIGNALKKQGETHTAAIASVNAKVAAQDAELVNFRRADDLATKDPDKYMAILANINPAFKAYAKGGAGAAAGAATTVAAGTSKLGPKPGPDIKYADGSTAFSPEQLEKREEWLIANAVEKATADAEARAEAKYGPLAKNFEGTQAAQARHERIMGIIQVEQQHWGEDFPKPGSAEEKEVDTLLKGDKTMTLRAAIHKVVMGKVKAGRSKVREEVLTEINGRKGASQGAPAAKKVVADPNEVRSTEDIIRESIAAAGLKG